MNRHLWIPDTQVRMGVDTRHIEALGNYIEEKRFEKIICAGDFWDMRSCSNYNTKEELEGQRVADDIRAGNDAMALLWKAVTKKNKMFMRNKKRKYQPEKHFLMGNHEVQLERLWKNDPRLVGLIGFDAFDIEMYGFKVHDFLKIVELDGISYSHYFYNASTGRPYSGMMQTRLKNIGFSFTQGHSQEFAYGERQLPNGKRLHGLVAGAFYMHDEGYKGPQGNAHWRGVVVKNEVRDGEYDIMKISLDYLLRKYL